MIQCQKTLKMEKSEEDLVKTTLRICFFFYSNFKLFNSFTALLATVPIPLRNIFSSFRLCLTFPWSFPTWSTVSPSWPIVCLQAMVYKNLLVLLLNTSPVMTVYLTYPLKCLSMIGIMFRIHTVQSGGKGGHWEVLVFGGNNYQGNWEAK